jgi:hypothetical protein
MLIYAHARNSCVFNQNLQVQKIDPTGYMSKTSETCLSRCGFWIWVSRCPGSDYYLVVFRAIPNYFVVLLSYIVNNIS